MTRPVSELVELRFQSGAQLSGNVGRDVKKGVVWDDGIEAYYQGIAAHMEFIDGKQRDEAEREALGFATVVACSRELKRAFRRAQDCTTVGDKRALFAEWEYRFGEASAKRIAAGFKDEATRKRVLGDECR